MAVSRSRTIIAVLLLSALCAGAQALNRAPLLDPIGAQEVLVGEALSFTLSATDPDGDQVFFAGSNLPIDSYLNPKTGQFRWAPALNQIGTYQFVFTASDDGVPTLSTSETVAVRVVYRLIRQQKVWGFGLGSTENIIETSELADLYPQITKIEVDGLAYPATPTVLYTSENPKIRIEASSPYNIDPRTVAVLLDGEQVELSPFSGIQTFGEQKNILNLSFNIDLKNLSQGAHTLSFRAGNDLGFSAQNITLNVGKLRLVESPLAFPVPYSPVSGGDITLQYNLSQDADIDIYIFSSSGQAVKKLTFAKGDEGGKTGLNKVRWDAKTSLGRPAGNGIYVGTIINKEDHGVLGKIKLVIY